MEITAIFNNVAIYGLAYKLDIKVGEPLTLVMDGSTDGIDVFVNNDKVLDYDHQGAEVNITTKSVGVSKIRIMKDVSIVRELLLNVVDNIPRPATTLNVALGQPEEK